MGYLDSYKGSGQGFLTDYSNLGAAGSAFQGFAEGMKNAQDQQMKKIEFGSQMEALKTKMQREKLQNQLDLAKEGYSQDDQGNLQEAKLSLKQRSANALGASEKGLKATGFDENGNPTSYGFDPNSAKAKEIDAIRTKNEGSLDLRKDTVDRREHEAVLKRLNNNPVAKQRLNQYQGLDNALSMITQVDHLTPQAINEFQQALRSQVTAAQRSGVAERGEDYYHNLGLNSATWQQFLTGNPADLAKDSKLVKHLVNSAQVEQGNVKKQYEHSLVAAIGGHSSMYSRRPDLKADLEDALSRHEDQFSSPQETSAPQTAPQGLIPDKKQGLLSGLVSSVVGPDAHAGGMPKVGEIKKGYRFKGGDPQNEISWEKVK